MRAALGAGRGRLVWQMLAESLLLSAAGGIVGLLLATWAVGWIGSALPAATSSRGQDGLGLNGVVAAFAAALIISPGIARRLRARAAAVARERAAARCRTVSRGATEGVARPAAPARAARRSSWRSRLRCWPERV